MTGKPWHDKEKLKELYWEQGLSQVEIGEKFDCNPGTIWYWLDKHGLGTRDSSEAAAQRDYEVRPVSYVASQRGYCYAFHNSNNRSYKVPIHRLTAVAKFGFDAVGSNVVHHKNKIPWDNRPENLEVLENSEHTKHHHDHEDIL